LAHLSGLPVQLLTQRAHRVVEPRLDRTQRPDGGFGRSALVYDGRDLVPNFVNPGENLLDLPNSTLEAGHTYSAQWRFTYNPDVSALPADQLILIADYGHARRFVAQAFAECGPSPKPHPQRSGTFAQY
jgi:hypothetical protein